MVWLPLPVFCLGGAVLVLILGLGVAPSSVSNSSASTAPAPPKRLPRMVIVPPSPSITNPGPSRFESAPVSCIIMLFAPSKDIPALRKLGCWLPRKLADETPALLKAAMRLAARTPWRPRRDSPAGTPEIIGVDARRPPRLLNPMPLPPLIPSAPGRVIPRAFRSWLDVSGGDTRALCPAPRSPKYCWPNNLAPPWRIPLGWPKKPAPLWPTPPRPSDCWPNKPAPDIPCPWSSPKFPAGNDPPLVRPARRSISAEAGTTR